MCSCLHSMLCKDCGQSIADLGGAFWVDEGKHGWTGSAERNAEESLEVECKNFFQTWNQLRPVWLMDSVPHTFADQRPVSRRQCGDRESGSLDIVDGILPGIRGRQNGTCL